MIHTKSEQLIFGQRTDEANPLGLPSEVLCLALNQPYADLVVGGVKTLETRTWPWPYGPSWLAVYATKTPDKEATSRLCRGNQALLVVPLGAIVGLVWIAGHRHMVREDEAAACYPYTMGRYVWTVERPHRFRVPDRDYLDRGPQKFVRIPRAVVLAGLAP